MYYYYSISICSFLSLACGKHSGMLGRRLQVSYCLLFLQGKVVSENILHIQQTEHKVTQALHCSISIFVLPPFLLTSMLFKLDF